MGSSTLIQRVRRNWSGAPFALRWLLGAWLAVTVISVLLVPKLTGLGRLGMSLWLFYHLLNKSPVARAVTAGFLALGAVLAAAAMRVSPVVMGSILMLHLLGAVYLMFSTTFKAWMNSQDAAILQIEKE